jgi:glycolate oxidase FAD binding subunit
MVDALRPRTPEEVADCVRWAVAEETPLEVIGHGSRRAIGRPSQTAMTLDLGALSGVTLYEPEELVLTARAGTPIAEIEALVASRGQELAFEPMDYGPLLGQPAGKGTLGGVLATNLAGPRRIAKGAARDHVLGMAAVSGRGEAFKSGGRVVKNVTGYDLPRGLAGSWGTLAVMTEITIKVLPHAETSASLVVAGLDPARAAEAMSLAMGSSAEVSGAAHLPASAAGTIADGARAGGRAATLLRLEGIPVSIAYRADQLRRLLKPFGTLERLDGAASEAAWRSIRDVRPFWPDRMPGHVVWRSSVAPTAGPQLAADVAAAVPGTEALFDWQGGLVWLALPAATVAAGAPVVRAAVAQVGGGHATLIRADAATRAAVPVFPPSSPAVAALTERLKAQFDPKGILNPGRMA